LAFDHYYRFILITIVLTFLLRIIDFIFLKQLDTFYPPPSIGLLIGAALTDNLLQIKYLLAAFPVFWILFLIHKRFAVFVWYTLLFVMATLSVVLILYTTSSAMLLDSVVLTYDVYDAIHVINPYIHLLVWLIILPILLFSLMVWLFHYKIKKPWNSFEQMGTKGKSICIILLLIIALLPVKLSDKIKTEYIFSEVVLTHKIDFLTRDIIAYITKPSEELLVGDFQHYFPKRRYTNKVFPLLHSAKEYRDMLSPYFYAFDEKPNLVFVIMESMGRDISGENAVLGSFTPFLDSLAKHSLVWENFVSTCERTYNVLPSLFGSLPYAEQGFVNLAQNQPLHYSLIHNLKNNGYFTGFYYGGWGGFDRMDNFLHRQNIDYFLQHFGKKYKPMNKKIEQSWGYGDIDLFKRAMEIIDSVEQQPRLDIYLTLTNHQPWKFNEQKEYIKKLKHFLEKSDYSASIQKRALAEKEKYSAILCADDAIRKMMSEYKKRKGYKNTIFIFTGDHAIWNNPVNGIRRYHVPFLIYSPQLKHGKSFPALNTHLDVAPSLEAFLSSHIGLKFPSESHYLGFSFDTSSTFRNQRTQIFKLSKKKVKHLISGLNYLDNNNLYEIDSLLNQTPIENEKVKNDLIKKREVMNTVHEKIPKYGLIVSESAYNHNYPILPFFPESAQTEEAKSLIELAKNDAMMQGFNSPKNWEYIGLSSLKLKKNTFNLAYFEIELLYNILSKQKNTNLSLMIAVIDRQGEKTFWDIPMNVAKDGRAVFNLKQTFILNEKNIRDCSEIQIYIWNKSKSEIEIQGVPKLSLSLE